MSSRFRNARDYNRSLVAPVRWAHLAWAVIAAVGDFGRQPGQRWVIPTLLAAAGVWLLWPWDAAVNAWARGLNLRGDLERELLALQQFGQGAFSLVIAAAIVLVARSRARRLIDWAAAAIVVGVTVNLVKPILGRPRPLLGEPNHLVGPFGKMPLADGPDRWTLESGWTAGYDLGSMPSRHAAFAIVAAVFLSAMFPRLKPLLWALAGLVCAARVLFNAHWLTDVILGAAIGYVGADLAVRNFWGVRALDWLWRLLVNRQASPALPRVLALEASHAGVAPDGAWATRPARRT